MTARRLGDLAVVSGLCLLTLLQASGASASPSTTAPSGVVAQPMFAYFDQGLTAASWSDPASDRPTAGRYSSDDRSVMTTQIEQAQSAGIDGFIVRWQNTASGERQLQALADIAARRHFALAMMYDALNDNGQPLPAASVAAGLKAFQTRFASNPVFYRIGGKPLTILEGTAKYSHASLDAITRPVRGSVLVLGTEVTTAGVQRIGDVTDGDAYFDPAAGFALTPTSAGLLTALGAAVHAADNYWIAPFGPGFSAGPGRTAVARDDGATLVAQYNAAVRSQPDVLGLASWNDYPSGSQVEPSQAYGHRSLDVLADLTGTHAPVPASAVDSSGSLPGAGGRTGWDVILVLIVVPVALLIGVTALGIALRRRRRRRRAVAAPPSGRHAAPGDSLVRSARR